MEEFIKNLKLEDNIEKALLGAFSQEKQAWNKSLNDAKSEALKEKEKIEKDFKDFKESVKDYDLIKKNLKTSQENEATLSKQNEELIASNKKDKIQFAIKDALNKAGARHTDLIAKDIDVSKLDIAEDGSIAGLDEAINKSKETYSDLFGPQIASTSKSASNTTTVKSKKDVSSWTAEDYLKNMKL